MKKNKKCFLWYKISLYHLGVGVLIANHMLAIDSILFNKSELYSSDLKSSYDTRGNSYE